MTLTIILILLFILISALAYMCHRCQKRYDDNCRLFAQRIQSPTVHDQDRLREKQQADSV